MNSMVLYKNNPFDLIDRFFSDDEWLTPRFRMPEIDVYEEENRYMLEADLPGLTEKDIKLEVRNGELTFSTSKMEKKEEKSRKGRWIRKERREFQFARSFQLPEDVEVNGIQATFKNGVLQISMPKKPESAPKTIEVKVN